MKRIFTILAAITIGSTAFGQVFTSDLSTWANGDPTDWMGTKSSIQSANVTELTIGATYGSSMASLVNEGSSHKRFSTQAVTVVPGETYEIKMWVAASQGSIRTGYYDLTASDWGGYGTYIDLTTASAGNLTMVSQTVTIQAGCTSVEFLLSIKETSNTVGVGMLLDKVEISTLAVTYDAKTISEIQTTTSGDSPEVGNFIETAGVVTATKTGGYWIQDGIGAWTGVFIKDDVNTPTMGDSVTVQGQVDEFFNLTQIKNISGYTLNSAPTVVPTAVEISTTDVNAMEEYECVLIRVADVECTRADAGYGQWMVNTDITVVTDSLLIDDDMYNYGAQVLGTHYVVTGISHYSYGARKLLPRMASDVSEFLSVEENTINANIYPNPANSNVTISGIENGNVSIYAINGEVVYNGKINGTLNINLQSLTTGMYVVEVIENNAKANYKLIVE